MLAAGERVTITSVDMAGVQFEVQAGEHEVVNLGAVVAGGGAVGVFAGSLRHSGEIRADTVSVDAQGRVILSAAADITLASGSVVSASGTPGGAHDGGAVRVLAGRDLRVEAGAEVVAVGGVDGGDGGFVALAARGSRDIVGHYAAGPVHETGAPGWLYVGDDVDFAGQIHDPNPSSKVETGLGFIDRPISFEANVGQADEAVDFISRGAGYQLYLTPAQTAFALLDGGSGELVYLSLAGANVDAEAVGEERLVTVSNYLIGDVPEDWITEVPHFARVRYAQVYDDIDLVYYRNAQGELEYDLEVAPGADPTQFALDYAGGAEDIAVDGLGRLVIEATAGQIIQKAPLVYQSGAESNQIVAAHYALTPLPGEQGTRVRIETAGYDASAPLIIDPVLGYSSYLGGDSVDLAEDIAVDSSGNAYVIGTTSSPITSPAFPTTPGALQPNIASAFNDDAFVTKFAPDGQTVLYSTYLGGTSDDQGRGIAVDANGNAYLVGHTHSSDFPTVNPIDGTLEGGSDAFVAKLGPSGSMLDYSTYLGGSSDENEVSGGIAIDSAGNAYVTGETNSGNFPTVNPVQGSLNGFDRDVFVTRINSTGSALTFSTYHGGGFDDQGNAISVNGAGTRFVVGGLTQSSDFPIVNAAGLQPSFGGGFSDGFVTTFNANGSVSIDYSTYLGGSGVSFESVIGVYLGSDDRVFATGATDSSDFPLVNAFDPILDGGFDAFLTIINASGNAFDASTFLGGNSSDFGQDIVVDSHGYPIIAGDTFSTDFPVVDPFQSSPGGNGDAFVSQFDSTGTQLVFSTYVGGALGDQASGVAVDSGGNIFVAGFTSSTDFPTASFQSTFGGGPRDAFALRLGDNALVVAAPVVTSTVTSPTAVVATDDVGGLQGDLTDDIVALLAAAALGSSPFVDDDDGSEEEVKECQ